MQVPAAATLEFYWRAAVVSSAATVPGFAADFSLAVSDPGDLKVNDTVRVGAGSSTLLVSDVVSATEILVTNTTSSSIALVAGVRLLVTSRRPSVYADPLGAGTGTSSISTDSTTGRAGTFLQADRLDYEVVISGEATRTCVDTAGRFGRSDQRWSDLRDFGGNLQTALDALPDDGGAIFIPRGEWLLPTGLLINKPGVTLFGEGHASVLKTCSRVTDMITVERAFFRMQDLTVDGGATSADPNGASCVVVRGLGQSGFLVLGLNFENVKFTRAPRHGLWMRDAIVTLVQNCLFEGNFGSGARVETPAYPEQPSAATTTQFLGCKFVNNADRGGIVNGVAELLFQGCLFEGNDGGVDANGYAANALEATSCIQIQVVSCVFRNPGAATSPANFLALNSCGSALVSGCYFDGGSNATKRPKCGVVFNASPWSRLSSCTGYRLVDRLAWFDGLSRDSAEYGNSEVEQIASGAPVRIRADVAGLQFVSGSRRAVSAPEIGSSLLVPGSGAVLAGGLYWDSPNGELRTWDGSAWRTIQTS